MRKELVTLSLPRQGGLGATRFLKVKSRLLLHNYLSTCTHLAQRTANYVLLPVPMKVPLPVVLEQDGLLLHQKQLHRPTL